MPCIIHNNNTVSFKTTLQGHDGNESLGVMRVETLACSFSKFDGHALPRESHRWGFENNKATFDMLLRLI